MHFIAVANDSRFFNLLLSPPRPLANDKTALASALMIVKVKSVTPLA